MHVANCFHTMGGGIARAIKERYPLVYNADKATVHGHDKLGTFSSSGVALPSEFPMVFNLYAQMGIGNKGHPLDRNLQYDCLFDSLWKAYDKMLAFWIEGRHKQMLKVALPHGIGCGLAGGNWNIVEKIIDEIDAVYQDSVITTLYKKP